MKKLQSLEMIRAVAAILVVLFHTQGAFAPRTGLLPFYGAFNNGFRGVDLFFVLSGFIIGYVHAADLGRPKRFGNYIYNRFARIYPSVWVMTVFAICLYASGFGGADKAGKLGFANVLTSAFLLPQDGDAIVNVTWTLKYEIFFYILFSLLIVKPRWGLFLLFLWQTAVLVYFLLFPSAGLGIFGFYLRPLCLEFGVGLFCAWLALQIPFADSARSLVAQWIILAGGVIAFISGMITGGHSSISGTLCALGSGGMIVALFLLEQRACIVVPRIFIFLGAASYSIYLVNFSVITMLAIVLSKYMHRMYMTNFLFLSVAMFAVLAGVFFYKIIDKPIQSFLKLRLKPALLGQKPVKRHI